MGNKSLKEQTAFVRGTLRLWPSPCLFVKCLPVDDIDDSVISIISTMKRLLEETNGRGLAATQVGSNKRIVLAKIDSIDKGVSVFINPEIVKTSDKTVTSIERCLSVPGVDVMVRGRYQEITVTAISEDGTPFQTTLYSAEAVLLEHEIDHINGKTIAEHVPAHKKERLKIKIKQLLRR